MELDLIFLSEGLTDTEGFAKAQEILFAHIKAFPPVRSTVLPQFLQIERARCATYNGCVITDVDGSDFEITGTNRAPSC